METTIFIGVLGFVAILVLIASRLRLSGTTLVAAWVWMLTSIVALTLVEGAWAYLGAPTWLWPLRYAAAMTTFCPLMAVLGARRPQHLAWQFVVLALWITLCVPAAQWRLSGGEGRLTVHPVGGFFLAILMVIGAMNYLPTRFSLPSALFIAGQAAMTAPFLPDWLQGVDFTSAGAWAMGAMVLALALAALIARRERAERGLDRVWLDFRDLFGAVWGLRIAERINSVSKMHGWNITLSWQGFLNADGESARPSRSTAAALDDSLNGLLRRFVSPAWIARRMDEHVD